MSAAAPRVTAVVVTYNRRDLLVEALDALAAQTRPPDAVTVVDNASSDGTPGLIRDRYPDADLVELGVNTGGAGGFAAGIARALDAPGAGTRLIWLMDDDTVPEPGALAALLDARDRAPAAPALVASRVVWTDGRDHPMNTPRRKPGASRAELAAAAEAGCMPVRSASFVSVLVEEAAVRERGLPVADYFLWNDDFEFTTRLLRGRTGLYCPASVVVHKTAAFGGTDADPGSRFYYEVRNKLWLFTRSPGLAPVERALYAGSSVRRWARTYVRSRDRATLRRGLREGVRDGLRRRPRPTEEVISAAVRRYDP
ncbi:glycosyltransferase [Actinomadura darangshiensis]|uniref:Glycosyltransferase n=1 Tax=Actinomadura darangshiensis TaxID=705336 RepID=A0A4R5ABR2_9ACTN|nr:glycosyltransferase [Actinomadura darangshiensis]TDD68429.1 glycosyltransferase [Actinomadura darangshiensis]